MTLCYLPDSLQVHAHVLMNEDISHAGNTAPGDIRSALKSFRRDSFDSFTDDLELPDYRVLPMRGGHEFGVAHGNIAFDLPDSVEHVL